MPIIPTILPKQTTDKYEISRNTFIGKDKGEAYFIAKCKNKKTDEREAVELSDKLGFKLWIPKEKVSYDFPKGAVECQKAINKAKIIICQTPIGRDCAWELGYAVAQKKPIYVIGKFDRDDWMTKLGNIIYVKD